MAAITALADDVLRAHLDLAWTWWTELGAPGARPKPVNVALHPEALIVFSASLVRHDARLRQAVIGWVLANPELVGSRQVLNVANRLPAVPAGMGDFTATLAAAGGPKWAGHTTGTVIPDSYAPLDGQPDLTRPSLALLRLRAAMGVHARAEVLSALARPDARPLTHTQIAMHVASTPRNVRLALDDLQASGVITSAPGTGGAVYRAQRLEALHAWLGPMAPMPPWVALLPALSALRRALTDEQSPVAQAVAAARALEHHSDTLQRLNLPAPPSAHGRGVGEEVGTWLMDINPGLATGSHLLTA